MVIIENMQQGTIDWILARLWRLTASNAKNILTPTGALKTGIAQDKYISKLMAGLYIPENEIRQKSDILNDWELAKMLENFVGKMFKGNEHTLRGHEYEDDALAAMADKHGLDFLDVGMCIMGDNPNGVVSCSPDRLNIVAGKPKTGSEVKSPCLSTYLYYVKSGIVPTDYETQMKVSMAVCDMDEWYFGAYFPGKPLFSKVITRDNTTDKIQKSLIEFRDIYSEAILDTQNKVKALQPKEITAL